MFCTECGTANTATAKFCHACGLSLTSSAPIIPSALTSESAVAASLDTAQHASFGRRIASQAVTASAPLQETQSLQSRTLLTVGGWCSILWGATIIAIALGTATRLVPGVAGGVLFIAYGAALITSHQSAVWLGWIICAAFGLAVLSAGLIPIQIVFWVLLACWVAYVQRRYRNPVAAAEAVQSYGRRASRRRWARVVLFGVGLTAFGLVSVGVWRSHLQDREAPNTILLSDIADLDCEERSMFANRPSNLERECGIRNADLESDFYALFRSEAACKGLRMGSLKEAPAVTEFGITAYIVPKYYLDVRYGSDEANQSQWRWTLKGATLTGAAPTLRQSVKNICDLVRSNGGQAQP